MIDGDPLVRIDDLTHVALTMKAGALYASPTLFATVGVAPWRGVTH